MKHLARMMMLMSLAATVVATSGCRYLSNRYYDFRDVFQVGAGVTAENSVTGVVPPSLGLHVQVTDFLTLGAITFNGMVAELDHRGTFVGPQATTQMGFLWWQRYQNYEDYENAVVMNSFKDLEFPWSQRMADIQMMWLGRPAKRLNYEFWSLCPQRGGFLAPSGYQYWGTTSIQLGLCDPLLTHLGFMLKAGFDVSELSDFFLGIVCIDALKHDDMTRDEYAVMCNKAVGHREFFGMDIVPKRARD
ncbi:hypothetical protein LLG95_11570 [bacterium]|nr:hypothetical protein [bacterium]